MVFSKAVAAVAGAAAFQAFAGLSSLTASRAAWGWQMTVPSDGGFSCEEGETIGCASGAGCGGSNFTCTVVAADGKTCDVSSISVVCSDSEGGEQNYQPNLNMCINVESYAASKNMTADVLSWSQVPSCTTTPASSAAAAGFQVLSSVGVLALASA